MTVLCTEGQVEASPRGGRCQTLRAGQILYLTACACHSLRAIDELTLLLTLAGTNLPADDAGEDAAEQRFSAGDASCWGQSSTSSIWRRARLRHIGSYPPLG